MLRLLLELVATSLFSGVESAVGFVGQDAPASEDIEEVFGEDIPSPEGPGRYVATPTLVEDERYRGLNVPKLLAMRRQDIERALRISELWNSYAEKEAAQRAQERGQIRGQIMTALRQSSSDYRNAKEELRSTLAGNAARGLGALDLGARAKGA